MYYDNIGEGRGAFLKQKAFNACIEVMFVENNDVYSKIVANCNKNTNTTYGVLKKEGII